MEKVQSFLKKHKKKLIILAVILVILITCLIGIKKLLSYFNPDSKESVYGDRCDLTEGIKIADEQKEAIKETVESYENMKLSTIDVKCNLIDIIVEVDDNTDVAVVKEMSNKILTAFTEEELKYYEISLWVDSNVEESEKYPIIGTRHKMINGEANNYFVW